MCAPKKGVDFREVTQVHFCWMRTAGGSSGVQKEKCRTVRKILSKELLTSLMKEAGII
jgi:hypothetical protein